MPGTGAKRTQLFVVKRLLAQTLQFFLVLRHTASRAPFFWPWSSKCVSVLLFPKGYNLTPRLLHRFLRVETVRAVPVSGGCFDAAKLASSIVSILFSMSASSWLMLSMAYEWLDAEGVFRVCVGAASVASLNVFRYSEMFHKSLSGSALMD